MSGSSSRYLQKWDFSNAIHTPLQEKLFRDLSLSDGDLTHNLSHFPPLLSSISSPSSPPVSPSHSTSISASHSLSATSPSPKFLLDSSSFSSFSDVPSSRKPRTRSSGRIRRPIDIDTEAVLQDPDPDPDTPYRQTESIRSSLQRLTSLHKSLTRSLSRIHHHLALLSSQRSSTVDAEGEGEGELSEKEKKEKEEEDSLLGLSSRHEMLRRLVLALESKLPFFYADHSNHLPAILQASSVSSTNPMMMMTTTPETPASPSGSASGSGTFGDSTPPQGLRRSASSRSASGFSVGSATTGSMDDIDDMDSPLRDRDRERNSDYFLRMILRLESALAFFRRGQVSGGIIGAATYVARFERRRELIWGEIRDRIVRAFQENWSLKTSIGSGVGEDDVGVLRTVRDELESLNLGCRDRLRKMRIVSGNEGVNLRPWIQELAKRAPKVYFNDVFAAYYNMRHALVIPLIQRSCQDAIGGLGKDNVVLNLRGVLLVLLFAVQFEKELFWELFGSSEEEFDQAGFLVEKLDESSPSPSRSSSSVASVGSEERLSDSDASVADAAEDPEQVVDRFELIRPLVDAYGVILFEMVRWIVIQNPYISHNIGILCDMIALMAEFMSQDRTLDVILGKIVSELEEAVGVKSLALLRDEVERLERDDVVMQLCDRLLRKLNGTKGFSRKLFEKIVQETVTSATKSLIRICQIKEKRERNQTTPLLFLLKHLLQLRRIISSFNVSLVKTQIELDFSHISEGIMNFLRGKSTIQIRSIIFDILIHSHPKVLYKKISTKRTLDHEIATVCENFILNVTKSTFGGLMAAVHGDNKNPVADVLYQAEIAPLETRLSELRAVVFEQLTAEEDQPTALVLVREVRSGLSTVYRQYVAKMGELFPENVAENPKIPSPDLIEVLIGKCLMSPQEDLPVETVAAVGEADEADEEQTGEASV